LEERNAARALCSRMEQDRSSLTRQLATRSADVQQVDLSMTCLKGQGNYLFLCGQIQIALDSEKLEVQAMKREVSRD
jgi:hypothetical protein